MINIRLMVVVNISMKMNMMIKIIVLFNMRNIKYLLKIIDIIPKEILLIV